MNSRRLVEMLELMELTVLDYASQLQFFRQNLKKAKLEKNPKDAVYWAKMLRGLKKRAKEFLPSDDIVKAKIMTPQQVRVKMTRTPVDPDEK